MFIHYLRYIFLQHDRARVIYKYALDHIPKEKTQEIYKAYTIHEKKYGDRSGIIIYFSFIMHLFSHVLLYYCL